MNVTRSSLIALVVTGTLVTSMQGSIVRGEQPVKTAVNQETKIIDVALNNEGTLKGKILNASQEAVSNSEVIISQGSKEIARTSSDEQGEFQVKQMEQGVYKLTSAQGTGYFRVWESSYAPPSAIEQVTLVSGTDVVRGQLMGSGMIGPGGVGIPVIVGVGAIAGGTIAIVDASNNSSEEVTSP